MESYRELCTRFVSKRHASSGIAGCWRGIIVVSRLPASSGKNVFYHHCSSTTSVQHKSMRSYGVSRQTDHHRKRGISVAVVDCPGLGVTLYQKEGRTQSSIVNFQLFRDLAAHQGGGQKA